MSLVFTAVIPHSPLLIPEIGKEQQEKLTKTHEAITALKEKLEASKPDVIVVLSPHAGLHENSFTINAHEEFSTDFSSFGNVNVSESWKGEPVLASKIAHEASEHDVKVQLDSQDPLCLGCSVPLHLLASEMSDVHVLPIGFSDLSPEEHVKFGKLLKESILSSEKRIAVIISSVLSHTLTEDAPGGYHEDGEVFDEAVIEALQTSKLEDLLLIKPSVIKNADQTGYRTMLIGSGILHNMNHKFELLCYEHPFGVGYLTGQFVF